MNQTYQATGIILKGQPLAETDRLVTVLTSEHGLIRAIAPGARKHKSRLRGRSELFVVNNLLIVKGRSLDKIIQADSIYTYPGLSRDLGKLAAAQYLAEVVLALALSEQPQIELYELINEHLRRLEKLANQQVVYPYLAHGVFHLLAIAGVAPQVHACCLTHKILPPNFTIPNWQVGFSFEQGGIINLGISTWAEGEDITPEPMSVGTAKIVNSTNSPSPINYKLNAVELTLMQQLSYHSLLRIEELFPQGLANLALDSAWIRIERILREYSQFYLGKTIRSATLVDNLYLVEF
jgi:DNA repair protein RecO (recombination protein O)